MFLDLDLDIFITRVVFSGGVVYLGTTYGGDIHRRIVLVLGVIYVFITRVVCSGRVVYLGTTYRLIFTVVYSSLVVAWGYICIYHPSGMLWGCGIPWYNI